VLIPHRAWEAATYCGQASGSDGGWPAANSGAAPLKEIFLSTAGQSAKHRPHQLMKLFDLSGEVAVVIGATGVLGGALRRRVGRGGPRRWPWWAATWKRGEARAKATRGGKGRRALFVAADAMSRSSLAEAHNKYRRDARRADDFVERPPAGLRFESHGDGGPSVRGHRGGRLAGEFRAEPGGRRGAAVQEFGSAMCQRGKGSIINIASAAAHIPLSRVVAYSAAKAGVLSVTKFLAREWAAKGVRVNANHARILPGRAESQAPLQ